MEAVCPVAPSTLGQRPFRAAPRPDGEPMPPAGAEKGLVSIRKPDRIIEEARDGPATADRRRGLEFVGEIPAYYREHGLFDMRCFQDKN